MFKLAGGWKALKLTLPSTNIGRSWIKWINSVWQNTCAAYCVVCTLRYRGNFPPTPTSWIFLFEEKPRNLMLPPLKSQPFSLRGKIQYFEQCPLLLLLFLQDVNPGEVLFGKKAIPDICYRRHRRRLCNFFLPGVCFSR